MSSLYDDLFEGDGKDNKPKPTKPQPSPIDDDRFQASTTESLDEILALTKRFNLKAGRSEDGMPFYIKIYH